MFDGKQEKREKRRERERNIETSIHPSMHLFFKSFEAPPPPSSSLTIIRLNNFSFLLALDRRRL